MAKNDNLTDFLTDVANAIREKKGTTDLINPQNFSDEIASIETGGGGGVAASANDVNFRDYDGTILYSYSKDEFLALSELPALPTQQGLICQGWNYSLEDAQSYVADYGRIEVGATYITDDGKTRLYIKISHKKGLELPFYFSQSVSNGVNIDWGDGSPVQSFENQGNISTTHYYAKEGDYIISLAPVNNCIIGFGDNSTNSIMGTGESASYVYYNTLQKVEIGDGVTSIDKAAFRYSGLEFITIPKGVVSISDSCFASCANLRALIFPHGITSIGNWAANYCWRFSYLSIPKSVESIGKYAFNQDTELISVTIPNSVIRVEEYAFSECKALKKITIPNSITYTGQHAFSRCYCLKSIVIPDNLQTIGSNLFQLCNHIVYVTAPYLSGGYKNNMFYNCYGVVSYDFTSCTKVPALNSKDVFYNIHSTCKIIVPDSLYNTWIAATNWSSLASNIVKASEYNG